MPSKTSWYKKEIGKLDFRSAGWISIVYLAGLIFALPMEFMMRVTSDETFYPEDPTLFSYHFEIQTALTFIIPVLLGIFLFRYLQVKNASDFIHSLPLKRDKIFHQHILNGLMLLLVPMVLTAVLLLTMHATMDLDVYFSISDVWQWIGVLSALQILIFFATVFVGMLTGISVVQGILTYILLLFPAGIIALVAFNLDYLLFGFSEGFYLNYNVGLFSPLIDFIEINMQRDGLLTKGIIYIVISLLLYFLSLQIYKRRPLETASQALVFSQTRPVFKYGVTACVMLVFGTYFGETQNPFYWIIFGYVLGSILGYLLAEMLLKKTWRVFGKCIGYLYFAVAAVIILTVLSFDITGYENRVPDFEDVDQVYVSDNSYHLTNEESKSRFLTNSDNVKAVQKLHQYIVQHPDWKKDMDYRQERIVIAYKMENGKRIVREYPKLKRYESYLKPIVESDEYKEVNDKVLQVDSNRVDKLTISAGTSDNNGAVIVDPEKITTALANLQEDIYNETYENRDKPRLNMSTITFLMEDNSNIRLQMKRNYSNLQTWLKERGLYEDAVITAKDVDHAVVLYDEHSNYHRTSERFRQVNETNDNALFIQDDQQIESLLKQQSGVRPNEKYDIALFMEGEEEPRRLTMTESDVPEFVIQHFN